jgi:hypothetical protein
MRRRELLVGSLSGAELIALARLARADTERPKELRIGYPKSRVRVIEECVLEQRLGSPAGRARSGERPRALAFDQPLGALHTDRYGGERPTCAS